MIRVDRMGEPDVTGAGVFPTRADAEDAVAMGVSPVSDGMSAQLKAAVIEGSGNAFINGVHTAVLLTAVLCAMGAALAAVGLRRNPRPPGTEG